MSTQKNNRKWFYAIAFVVVLLAATAGYIYWSAGFVATDDALVSARQVVVSTKIPGRLALLTVHNGSHVNAGDRIAQIETTDLKIQEEGAQAAYQSASAKFQALAEGARAPEVALAEASRQEAETSLTLAENEFDRATELHKEGIVASQALDRAKAGKDAAVARLREAENRLSLLRMGLKRQELRAAAAEAERAKSQWNLVKSQLAATDITSPVTGTVAKEVAHNGEFVQPGQPIVYITDESDIWVTAYLEESKLHGIHAGSPATVSLDVSDETVPAIVRLIGNVSASTFSLFPPDNAAGNFTKVSQRIPIELKLEKPSHLVPGSSAEVKFPLR
jgi:multidrug resistance efflux pump